MNQKIDDPIDWYIQVARTEIAPLLEEYWLDNPERAPLQGRRRSSSAESQLRIRTQAKGSAPSAGTHRFPPDKTAPAVATGESGLPL